MENGTQSKTIQFKAMSAFCKDHTIKTPPMSYFEFWPGWLFYFPMKIYALYLSFRYWGVTLPTISNPLFDVGGFHGESKAQIYTQIPKESHCYFATTAAINIDENRSSSEILKGALTLIEESKLDFPLVAKPDIGMRGMGVQRVYGPADLLSYISSYPTKATFILQNMHDFPLEVGLFYIRKPNEEKGRIFSLTLKQFSYVTGDGTATLKELIARHDRFGKIAHIYLPRHKDNLDMILGDGEDYRIAFAGSHSRGTIFRDGNHCITPKMEEAWDRLAKTIPEFYFGRFDVRFHKMEDLETLDNLKIVEINGAGAEATHIWDPAGKLLSAYKTLMEQYKLMYEIGALNRARGYKSMPLGKLMKRMKAADALFDYYPHTH